MQQHFSFQAMAYTMQFDKWQVQVILKLWSIKLDLFYSNLFKITKFHVSWLDFKEN